jgi:hypothetical protein
MLRFLALGAIVLALMSLAGCDWLASLFAKDVTIGSITWDKTARKWNGNNNWTYTVTLPAGGSEYEIWGTDIYTDDSSIGTAAVHKGLITFGAGGTVTIRILPGEDSCRGTLHNGVTSQDYGNWDGSFEFVIP